MFWCKMYKSSWSWVYTLTVVALLGLFGFSPNTSEPAEREETFGSIDCPEKLSLRWNELLSRPPYVEREGNSTEVFGLFPDFLEMMFSECCQLSTTLIDNSSAVEPDLDLPVVVNLEADVHTKKHSNLVPIVPHAGIAFVVVKDTKSNHSLQMLKSLFTTWPVLVLTLILSLIAGIIAWSLETKTNPDNFPPTFMTGTWEGFWWAFISMTTVGYGDRCPQSVGGRLFAVIWILIGICVCSVFTAALTTSLTTLSMETNINLPGAKVVVLLDSIESTTGFQNQANLRRVKTADDIHKELQSGSVQGALMDAYFLIYYSKNYPTTNLKVQEVIQQDKLEYGVRLQNTELANCFWEKRYTMESSLYEMANMQSLASGLEEGNKDENNLFDTNGILLYPVLFTCFGVTAVLLAVGVAWDLCHRFRCRLAKTEERSRISSSPSKTSWYELSCSSKYYIAQEHLKDLENKIREVNKALDLIKNGISLETTDKEFPKPTFGKAREEDEDQWHI